MTDLTTLRQRISDASNFDGGEKFGSEEQVRGYFRRELFSEMFGASAGNPDYEPPEQDELDSWADTVIENRWHCGFGDSIYRISVDDENNSEAWWDAFKTNKHPRVWKGRDHWFFRKRENAEAFLEAAKALPGWNDPDAPEYAPHPLIGVYEDPWSDWEGQCPEFED